MQRSDYSCFNGATYSCAFGPRNQFAFSTRDSISIVDADSWNETTAIPAAGDVAFSKDGSMLLVSKPGFINGQTVSLWDAATDDFMQGVDNTEYALSPDGNSLLLSEWWFTNTGPANE